MTETTPEPAPPGVPADPDPEPVTPVPAPPDVPQDDGPTDA